MRICLITTTVSVPTVLRKYRELGPSVEMFIAGDVRGPHEEIEALAAEIGGCTYLRPAVQESLYPELSEAIGWNCIMRRNIAILEAARTEPDVILSLDDDNLPMGDYFADLERSFQPRHRPQAIGPWFNLGDLATDRFTYRGFPFSVRGESSWSFSAEREQRPIGVVNGAIYGDPDINAVERIAVNPQVSEYDSAVHHGIVCNPAETLAPINSQNTAWRLELAHLSCVYPGVGRYDDIWPSYVAQREMAGEWSVLFGKPFVRQERHPHDLLKDLEDELMGMRHTEDFIAGTYELPLQTERFLEEWRRAWQSILPLPQAA